MWIAACAPYLNLSCFRFFTSCLTYFGRVYHVSHISDRTTSSYHLFTLPQISVGWSRLFWLIISWLLSTSWRPRIWSPSLALTWMPFLLPSLIAHAHLLDLNMAGIRQYLCFVARCTSQWRPPDGFGILLVYRLHHRHLLRFQHAQHGLRPHHLSHLHRLRSPNNLPTTPILHLNDTLSHRDRRDLCHLRAEALLSMRDTLVGQLKFHR